MRITNNMMARTLVSNLHSHLRRMETLHYQLSSGRRLRVASDDPVATATSMRLHTHRTHTLQQQANVSSALSWLEATDAVLGEATDAMQRALELAVYGASGSHPPEARDAIASEIDQILEHIVDLANASHAGLFLFGGNKTLDKPYDIDPSDPIDAVPGYGGDDGLRTYEIGAGVKVAVNVPGDVVFDPLFDVLIQLRDNLRSGNIDELGGPVLENLQKRIDGLLSIRADVGARANRMSLAAERLKQLELNIEQLIVDNEGVDVVRALTDLKVSENVYRAALGSGARIIPPTLLDFLR